ncbi:cytochrome C oxidase subunit IV family protein [Ruegeria aquimaris]|uniref:Cytochrome C oxidase subunit IV family protein n=1 Tax=Ruegeria aquimaris TaxID=2984333 RepID=A0ABT3ANP4_9RHOB|nr:cytochrome C oxidase subunit IV family protein [Ruegeria sp. XHP0148]MCV2890273.1 cytochrome C oxidase subunit IV family protein [Ruegeria sp. XHP0148]
MTAPNPTDNTPRHGHRPGLTTAWLALLVLSLASTGATVLPVPQQIVATAVLVLALIKARVILARYLELSAARSWLSGLSVVIAGFFALVLGLFLIYPAAL